MIPWAVALIAVLIVTAPRAGIHEVIRKPFTMGTVEESLTRHFPCGRQGGMTPAGAH